MCRTTRTSRGIAVSHNRESCHTLTRLSLVRDVGHEVKRVVLLASTVPPLDKEGFLPGISVVNRPNRLAVANRQPLSIRFGGKRLLDIKLGLKVSIRDARTPGCYATYRLRCHQEQQPTAKQLHALGSDGTRDEWLIRVGNAIVRTSNISRCVDFRV